MFGIIDYRLDAIDPITFEIHVYCIIYCHFVLHFTAAGCNTRNSNSIKLVAAEYDKLVIITSRLSVIIFLIHVNILVFLFYYLVSTMKLTT